MGGLVIGAMSGAGDGLMQAGRQFGDYLSKSKLQEEGAEIQRLRDERLAELRKGELRFAEDLRREPGRLAQQDIEAGLAKPAYDPATDSVRPHSPAERADIEQNAFRKHGLVAESMQVRSLEQQRVRDQDSRIDRDSDNRRADEQLAETKRHNQRVETLQAAAEGRLKKVADMDAAIKQIALDNAKRVKDLQTEFSTSTDPKRKQAINEEIQLITGKDNDNYLPVPLKDETGAITGYRIFDKKRGTWQDGEGGAPKPKGDRPPLENFDPSRKPKPAKSSESPASGGSSTPPAAARQSGGERQRDMAMEGKDRQLAMLAVSLQSKDPNENTRAWIAYTKRLQELRAGP